MSIIFHFKNVEIIITVKLLSRGMLLFPSFLDEMRKEIRKLLFTRCEKTEINLRKYRILGGALHIDLVYQPPQPKDMQRDIMLTTCEQ